MTILMTEEQTEVYDGGNEAAQTELMTNLRLIAREAGDYVEIQTFDGIVAEVVDSRE